MLNMDTIVDTSSETRSHVEFASKKLISALIEVRTLQREVAEGSFDPDEVSDRLAEAVKHINIARNQVSRLLDDSL